MYLTYPFYVTVCILMYSMNPSAYIRSNVVFSQSGQYMICSTLDSTHRLYRIPNNDTLLSFQGGSCSIDVCKRYLSHTNKRYSIFSAVSSVWDEARSSSVGSYLASGSEDNKIYLWDLNGDESTPAAVLSGHQGMITAKYS